MLVALLILLLAKFVCCSNMVRDDLQNPIMASVGATFPMGLKLLVTYCQSEYLWFFTLGIHMVWIFYFAIRFLIKWNIKQVYATYFIVYVGIVAASVTAPSFNMKSLGEGIFWFGVAALVLTGILVTIRYMKYEVLEPAKPLICIYAAPTSLCLAGYLQSADNPSSTMILGLFVVSMLLYIFSLIQFVRYLRLKFYPSFVTSTFPFVISAIASKQTMVWTISHGRSFYFFSYLVGFETVIAVVLMVYVSLCCMKFFFIDR